MVNPYQAQYAPTDLQIGVTPTGSEVAHWVQGGASVQLSISQIMGAVPTLVSTPGMQAALLQGALNFAALLVNFNAGNTDTQIPITLPTGYTTYRIGGVFIARSSGSLSTATCGLFTAAAGGGVAIVTAATAITVTTGAANSNNNSQSFTVNNQNTLVYNVTPLFFRVANPQGVAATADVIINVVPLL